MTFMYKWCCWLPTPSTDHENPTTGEPHPLCCLEDECALGTLRAQNARALDATVRMVVQPYGTCSVQNMRMNRHV